MHTGYATIAGEVTDRLISYYVERAKGGVGLIDVEFSYVAPNGKIFEHMLGIYDQRLVPGLKRLTDAIHLAGAKVAIQISHGGRRARSDIIDCLPIAPSPIPTLNGDVPREMSLSDIEEMIDVYIMAGRRAKEAGFDGVMIHMAHGYLIQQFLSPLSNRRMDRYGKDLKGRSRFAIEILKGVRQEVGRDYPITCRFCGDEFLKGGISQKMAIQMAKLLEANGIDAIEISAGTSDVPRTTAMMTPYLPMGHLAYLSAGIKKEINIPVGIVGRIHNPWVAESILREREADLIAVGRGLIADPEWPKKALEGRPDDICPCISCNKGCIDRMSNQLDVSCTVNPAVGRETIFPIKTARRKKNVLILGGGPAGLEAARIAAMRGNKVQLFEKEEELGGQLKIASAPPGKEILESLRQFLIREIEKLGVEVKHEKIDRKVIKKLSPDEIVVAVGGDPKALNVPGSESKKVFSAWEVLSGKKQVGQRVVIIGGGQVGLETADFLLTEKKRITILEMLKQIGQDMGPIVKRIVVEKLIQSGVEILTEASVLAIEEDCVVFNRAGVVDCVRGVDSIIVAVGTVPQEASIQDLEKVGNSVRLIGDCLTPKKLFDAIHGGFMAGIEI
jgi:2,4-dienoyl-CoA reductase-like NADH-dependent reductase (Old Yellow Enzyme family)/thioredoxin reductase